MPSLSSLLLMILQIILIRYSSVFVLTCLIRIGKTVKALIKSLYNCSSYELKILFNLVIIYYDKMSTV